MCHRGACRGEGRGGHRRSLPLSRGGLDLPLWRGSLNELVISNQSLALTLSTDGLFCFPLGVLTSGSSKVLKIIRWDYKACGILAAGVEVGSAGHISGSV